MKYKKVTELSELKSIDSSFIDMIEYALQEDEEIDGFNIYDTELHLENLTNITFSNSKFDSCIFSDCKMLKNSFVNCEFIHCDFSNCNMENSYFSKCEISNSKFMGVNLNQSIIKNVNIIESNFDFSIIDNANVSSVEFIEVSFKNANILTTILKKSTFSECEFIGTNFFRTALKGIDLRGNKLEGLIVSDNYSELRGAIVDTFQASELSRLLGVIIK